MAVALCALKRRDACQLGYAIPAGSAAIAAAAAVAAAAVAAAAAAIAAAAIAAATAAAAAAAAVFRMLQCFALAFFQFRPCQFYLPARCSSRFAYGDGAARVVESSITTVCDECVTILPRLLWLVVDVQMFLNGFWCMYGRQASPSVVPCKGCGKGGSHCRYLPRILHVRLEYFPMRRSSRFGVWY